MKFFIILFLFLSSSYLIESDGLKILAIFPFDNNIRYTVGSSIIKSLVNVGHEATVLSVKRSEQPIKGYHEIDISSALDKIDSDSMEKLYYDTQTLLIAKILTLNRHGNKLVDAVLLHENTQKLLKSKDKFDVCFLEYFYVDALVGIFDYFDCIFVPFSSTSSSHLIDLLTTNQSPPSYIPSTFLSYSGTMTFNQRWINTLVKSIERIIYYTYHRPTQRALYHKYFPNAKQSYDEIMTEVSIAFVNSHFSLTGAQPRLPNIIDIAGVHIEREKSLPSDLKRILDFSEFGAIVVSNFEDEILEKLLKVFGKLNQDVVLSFDGDNIESKPENVILSKSSSQRDVFSHHNVKLLIAHDNDYLSIMEALSLKVPVLIIGDEKEAFLNSCLKLNKNNLNEENIQEAITKIIEVPHHKQQAEIIAERFHERTINPSQAVVYWTEFVARNNGAPHLKSAGRHFNIFEFHSLDVYFVIIALITVSVIANYLFFYAVFRGIFKKNGSKFKKE